MARSQRKPDAKGNGRQSLDRGKCFQGITKHNPQPATRKSARLQAILHLEEQTGINDGQTTRQHSLLSLSTNKIRNSNLPTCKKHSGLDQRPSRKRKRSPEAEDPTLRAKDQHVDTKRKISTKENEEHHQLLSPSTSISCKQLSVKKRRAVFPRPRSEEINRYSKRRKALRRTPQTVQSQETVPEATSPIFKRPVEGPRVSESKWKDEHISYWAANRTWPDNFAESLAMSLNHTNKRLRTSYHSQSSKDEKSRSYSQGRKDGDVPEQYTKSYEMYIFTQGLDMNYIKGREFVSPDSKVACQELRNMECAAIFPTIYSDDKILQVVDLCQNENEAMVGRDITTLILPPIKALHLMDETNCFKDFTDQVRAQWHESWVLAGPRPEPDLAVGFLHSAFTVSENEKLTNYTSFENLTRPTNEMCFPFLMCEVQCGDKALDYADRQNMHSCSVAVKALLKLEQKADQYRKKDRQFESLLGKILVYSISHDQNDARVWGYYALAEGSKWTYYRHHIGKFDIAHEERSLLALRNFARNVLTEYAPELLKRIQKAIAVLPVSTTLSFSTSNLNLEDDSQQGSQQLSQVREAEGFATPDLPASTQKLLDAQKEQTGKLLDAQKEQMEKLLDAQKELIDGLLQQLEQQRKENKEREVRMERQNKTLTDLLAEQIAGRKYS